MSAAVENPSEARPHKNNDGEGVEVVMDSLGKESIVDSRPPPDQNVFRPPHAVRPRAVRGGPPPHVKSSGSYGYPSHAEYGHRPYAVPYNPSGSFEEGGPYPPPPPHSHYSPHIQYPPHGGRRPEDVNVISPSHKTGEPRPPATPSRRYGGHSSYQYPPASPVSRPGGLPSTSPPRMRNYRRHDSPYSSAQRGRHPEDGSWPYATPADRSRPPLVTESSFDSEHYSSHASHASHPTTPNAPHYGPPVHSDPHYGGGAGFYGGSFGGSFDSHAPPPPYFDDYRYYGHRPPPPPHHHHPESPYSPYSYNGYSPGGYHEYYSPHPDYGHHGYEGGPNAVTPKRGGSDGMLLPKAAAEVDFDISDPPAEPVTPPSTNPVCESPADINSYDVLLGRGGGTNSQAGNRRFRKLVQDFQPTYLLARRKEKPLLARTIVLIIRKRGGRFLKKDDETGELYEVGDIKAEAKTSQALREGLDVRATKSAASNLMKKKKKKSVQESKDSAQVIPISDEHRSGDEAPTSPEQAHDSNSPKSPPGDEPSPGEKQTPQSPPTLPRLNGEEKPTPRPPSPENSQFRKRRRMRSGDAADPSNNSGPGCGSFGFQDKLFPDFCPPRADLARATSPTMASPMHLSGHATPTRSNSRAYDEEDDDDIRLETEAADRARGCAGFAFDLVTGAAAGSFCLGPRKWK